MGFSKERSMKNSRKWIILQRSSKRKVQNRSIWKLQVESFTFLLFLFFFSLATSHHRAIKREAKGKEAQILFSLRGRRSEQHEYLQAALRNNLKYPNEQKISRFNASRFPEDLIEYSKAYERTMCSIDTVPWGHKAMHGGKLSLVYLTEGVSFQEKCAERTEKESR